MPALVFALTCVSNTLQSSENLFWRTLQFEPSVKLPSLPDPNALVIGSRRKNDRHVRTLSCKQEGIPGRTVSEKAEFRCPDNIYIVTAVEVYNTYTVTDKVGYIRIIGGGIGTQSIKLKITSLPGFGYSFDILVYGYMSILPIQRSNDSVKMAVLRKFFIER